MANKRITDVDFLGSLNNGESFFVNQNNTVKQINKKNITFDIANGGTGATSAEKALVNLGAVNKAGDTMSGTLIVPNLGFKLGDSDINRVSMSYNEDAENRACLINYHSDQDNTTARYFDGYCFPSATPEKNKNDLYDILTTKSPVTIEQGGTGATTLIDAQNNLGITELNQKVNTKSWAKAYLNSMYSLTKDRTALELVQDKCYGDTFKITNGGITILKDCVAIIVSSIYLYDGFNENDLAVSSILLNDSTIICTNSVRIYTASPYMHLPCHSIYSFSAGDTLKLAAYNNISERGTINYGSKMSHLSIVSL